jgi:hypothetical protein
VDFPRHPRRLTFALYLSLEPFARHARNDSLRYLFEDFVLDTDRRELRRRAAGVPTTPQVFDLLDYPIQHRDRVASKDDLINAIWNGRIVSDAGYDEALRTTAICLQLILRWRLPLACSARWMRREPLRREGLRSTLALPSAACVPPSQATIRRFLLGRSGFVKA